MNIEFSKVMKKLLSKVYIILAAAFILGALGLLIAQYIVDKEYESDVTLYVRPVLTKENEDLMSVPIENYVAAGMSVSVINAVLDNPAMVVLGLNYDDIKELLTVTRKASNIIQITCTAKNADYCQTILQAYMDAGVPILKELVKLPDDIATDISPIDLPRPGELIERDIIMVVILFGLVGALLAVVVLAYPYLTNKVSYDTQDLWEAHECPVLTEIKWEEKNEKK